MSEILDMIQSCQREERRRRKDKIIDDFIISEVTARNVAAILFSDKEIKTPKPWDYYEKLFSEEKKAMEPLEREIEFAEYQRRRKDYFDELNRRRHMGM